ncbi:hypothetical protein I4L40_001582 [Campylobacter jejuni]|nr:hypothetical protein [Campylobacter jejuni]
MAAVNLKEGNAKLNKESSATTIVAENESLKALKEENAKLKAENESLKALKEENAKLKAENESLKALQEQNAKLKAENESLKLNGKSKFTESKVQG